MAKLFNLARMTVTSTGTGTLTMGVAVAGYLTFALAGVVDGDVVAYGIRDGSNSEVGTGTVGSSGTTLTRTVRNSTNSGSPINVTTSAQVVITPGKEDFYNIHFEDSGTNTIVDVLKLTRSSSGSPAAGIGGSLSLEVETAAGNLELGARIAAVATDVTSTAEKFDLRFYTMDAGVLGTDDNWRITSVGCFVNNGNAAQDFRSPDGSLIFPALQVLGDEDKATLALAAYTTDGDLQAQLILARSNNDTVGNQSVLTGTDDEITRIAIQVSDGTDFQPAFQLRFLTDAAHSSTSIPVRLSLVTCPTGSLTEIEALRVEASGTLQMMNNNMVNVRGTAGDKSHGILWDSVLDGPQIRGFAGIKFMRGTNGATEMARFDSSSHFIQGGTASLAVGGSDQAHQIWGTTTPTAGLSIGMFNTTEALGPTLNFYRSKNASLGQATVVDADDVIGSINWYAAQQTGTFASQTAAAQILVDVDSGVTVTSGGTGDMAGRLRIFTTPDGSGTLTEALRVDNGQRVLLGGASQNVRAIDSTAFGPNFQINKGTAPATASLISWTTSGNSAPVLILARSNNNTVGTHSAALGVDEEVGRISFQASDSVDFEKVADIRAFADLAHASGDVPGRLAIYTTPDGSTGGTEAIRWDNAQRTLLHGTTSLGVTAITGSTDNPGFQIGGATATKGTQAFFRFSADSNGPRFVFAKSRGSLSVPHSGTPSSRPNSGDSCGDIAWNASDETNFELIGRFRMEVDGSIFTDDTPGRFVWFNTPSGTNSPSVTMRLMSDGSLRLGPSGTADRMFHVEFDDATTNGIVYLQRLTKTTSGTGAIGHGTGIEFEVETAASNVGATVECIAINATSGQATYSLDARVMGNSVAGEAQSLSTFNRLLSSNTAYTNNNSAQDWFPSSGDVDVQANTTYEFEGLLAVQTTSTTTAHTISTSFAGTATLTSIAYHVEAFHGTVNTTVVSSTSNVINLTFVSQASATVVTSTSATTSALGTYIYVRGIVRINAVGTFIPQWTMSTARGAGNVLANSFFKMRKIGTGSVTSQGRWT